MAANSVHADYERFANSWQRIRDVLAGEDAMKAAAERYVPRLDSQTDVEYLAYIKRGFFYNATARTVAGFLGLIFRKDPEMKIPTGSTGLGAIFHSFQDDVDLLGTTLASYSRNVIQQVITLGRVGTLIDWQDQEARAYLAFYTAENILNWRQTRLNGRLQLSLIVLREWISIPDEDSFGEHSVEQLRVLRLMPDGQGGQSCRVELWRQLPKDNDDKQLEWQILDTRLPMRHGKSLSLIPFVFHGPSNDQPQIERSPIEDIIHANIAHYRVTVDFQHGMHYTALPTAWVSGFPKETNLKIGAQAAWVTDTVGATAGYLEFRGEGLMTFERALDRIERLLTVLGSRLLESQKRVSESAEALSIRQSSESSILANLAKSSSASLTDVLRWFYWWHSTEDNPASLSTNIIKIELNTDYETALITPKEIESLVTAWQAGALSRDSLHYQFRRGELLPPGRTLDEELALIQSNPPPAPPAPTPSLSPLPSA